MAALSDRLVAFVLALGVLAALITTARAGPYEDGLDRFTADGFNDTIEGVNAIAASGNPLAVTVIAALQEGRLFFSAQSKQVLLRDSFDRLIDAATGAPFAGTAPADLAPVRLNNRLRRIVEAALGSLTLMAPDPGKRLEAAQAVFRSKDPNALAALDQAIARETDSRVKRALIEARAAVVLYFDSAAEEDKIDAVRRDPRSAAIRTRLLCSAGSQPTPRPPSRRPPPTPLPRSRTALRSGPPCRMPGTASRSARCCCSPPSALPSPSA